MMGEWKAWVTMSIRPALRVEMEQFAAREQRSHGSTGVIPLDWGFEHLSCDKKWNDYTAFSIGPCFCNES
jgi:hypothetical protein